MIRMVMPLKPIDRNQVHKLAAMFCTDEEIADFFDCAESTLKRRFREELKRGRSVGKMSLKRKQYDQAMGGNTAMLIWLGKQYLGQRDKVDQEFVDRTPGRVKPVEKLTDEELKAELAKNATAVGAAGGVESPPGAEEPA